jgi:predicted O-linked N-acetylglucosamine transferase (SPINDLY family)
MSSAVLRKLQQAFERLQNGEADAAATLCADVLRRAPKNPDALWLLGTARLMTNRVDEAIPLFEQVLVTSPGHGAALENLGLACLMRGNAERAEALLRRAAEIPNAPASVFMRLGLALLQQARNDEAAKALERAVQLAPDDMDPRINLGRAYAAQGRWPDAAREFQAVLARHPQHADTLFNLGVVILQQGMAEDAIGWFDRCLAHAPEHIDARERRAAAYLALGRFPQAADDLRTVVSAQPSNATATFALAEAMFQRGSLDDALQTALRARDLDPSAPGPYTLISLVHNIRGELDHAVQALEEGYSRTRADPLIGALVHVSHRQCDWPRWTSAWQIMHERLDHSTDLGSPFWLLQEDTTAQQQLAYTKRWAAQTFRSRPAVAAATAKRATDNNERLRIGYYSGDFQQHPVACLFVEVLELHDRDRFEIFTYSYGPDDGSDIRRRFETGVEHFIDVAWEPNDVVVNRIRSDSLDLLIEPKGYTAGDRLGVMAQRPSPRQATWLGYPGTSGAEFIDYIIADEFIIPPGAEPHYSERVLRLPHCYQANDRKRRAAAPRTRIEYGLPEDAFVFCCFNQTVKITPAVFERWMALLRAVPRSVLWLLEDNRWATQNLLAAAGPHGVARERVVVAPRLPLHEHLARYAVADLALDTFPYTSHTTGSDALWLGCPLVALCGDTFAARVSGSLLVNCSLPDLVTSTLDDYERLALRLATDADLMKSVRQRLAAARDTAPLFDSQRFARDLEQLYLRIILGAE